MVRINDRSKLVRNVRCNNGRCVYRVQAGNGLMGNLFKMGARAVKRLAKSVNWGALGRKAFNTGKKIAITAEEDFVNKHKKELIDKGSMAASEFVADNAEKIVNDLVKSKNINEATNSLKRNVSNLPANAKTKITNLVNDSKGDLL